MTIQSHPNSQRCTKSYVSNHSIVKKKKTNHNSYRSLNIFPRDSDRDYSHYRRVNKYEVNRVCTRRLARMVERGPEAFLALFRSALAIILCSIDLVRRVTAVKKKGKERKRGSDRGTKKTRLYSWRRSAARAKGEGDKLFLHPFEILYLSRPSRPY